MADSFTKTSTNNADVLNALTLISIARPNLPEMPLNKVNLEVGEG